MHKIALTLLAIALAYSTVVAVSQLPLSPILLAALATIAIWSTVRHRRPIAKSAFMGK